MKHIKDMSQDTLDKITDVTSERMTPVLDKLCEEFKLCEVCMHSIVIHMCQAFINHIKESENGTKH